MKTALDAIDLSGELLEEWLGTCMFNKDTEGPQIDNIVKKLNEHDKSKNHGRHLNIEFCKRIGLKIHAMEDEPSLQDLALSVHHAYMITLDGTPVVKIIENDAGKAMFSSIPS